MSHPEIPSNPLLPDEISLDFFNRLKEAKSPEDVKSILEEIKKINPALLKNGIVSADSKKFYSMIYLLVEKAYPRSTKVADVAYVEILDSLAREDKDNLSLAFIMTVSNKNYLAIEALLSKYGVAVDVICRNPKGDLINAFYAVMQVGSKDNEKIIGLLYENGANPELVFKLCLENAKMDTSNSSRYKTTIANLMVGKKHPSKKHPSKEILNVIEKNRLWYQLLKFEDGAYIEKLTDSSLVDLELILFRAIEFKDLDLVETMINENPDLINAVRKSDEFTPLTYAALHNRLEIFNFLIERGANINYRHPCGLSAYGISVAAREIEVFVGKAKKDQENGITAIFYSKMEGSIGFMLHKKSAEIEGSMLDATEEAIESAISEAMATIRRNPEADAIESTKEYDDQFLNRPLNKAQAMIFFSRELALSDRFDEWQKSKLKDLESWHSSQERKLNLSWNKSERFLPPAEDLAKFSADDEETFKEPSPDFSVGSVSAEHILLRPEAIRKR